MIKVVYAVDSPPGKRKEYLEWVRAIAATLQAPDEVRRVASYDNYFAESPYHVIEFEFDDPAALTRYTEHKEIRRILEELPSHASHVRVTVLTFRGDYTKRGVAP